MKWGSLFRFHLGKRASGRGHDLGGLSRPVEVEQRIEDLVQKILADPSAQLAVIERKTLAALKELGLTPPFDQTTFVDEFAMALEKDRYTPLFFRPKMLTDEGGPTGLVYFTDEGIFVMFVPSEDPRTEFLSKVHELCHVLHKHPIPQLKNGAFLMQGELLRDVDDHEAEQSAALLWRYVFSHRLPEKSAIEQLLDD